MMDVRGTRPCLGHSIKPDLPNLPEDAYYHILEYADLNTCIALAGASTEIHRVFKEVWMDAQNKVKNFSNKIEDSVIAKNSTLKKTHSILAQKYERKYPPLHLSDITGMSSLENAKSAIQRYNQQIQDYHFLTQYKDKSSNEDLWKRINDRLQLYPYNKEKKIPFYTFCLSYNKLAENAAEALMNLAATPENRVLVAKAGAIKPLVKLLDGTDRQKEYAAGALGNLAANNPDNQKEIAKAGAIEPLIEVLRNGEDFYNATWALRDLAANNPDNQKAIMGKLVESLKDGTDNQKRLVAEALEYLATNNPDNKNAYYLKLVQ